MKTNDTEKLLSPHAFNPNIHGLRGLAVLFVFFFHSYVVTLSAGATVPPHFLWLDKLFACFNAGVDIFFMISGYLIMASLIRIYPVLLFLVTFLFLIAPHLHYKWTAGLTPGELFAHYISNILLLPGVFPLPRILGTAWTLSYEFCFYFFSAAVYVFWKNKRGLSYLLLYIALPLFLYFYPVMIGFAAGTSAYFVINRDWQLPLFLRKIKPFLLYQSDYLAAIALLVYIVLLSLNSDTHFTGTVFYAGQASDWLNLFSSQPVQGNHQQWLVYFATLFGAVFFIQATINKRRLAGFLQNRYLQYVGTISYSVYMWHWPLFSAMKMIVGKLLIDKLHFSFFITYSIFTFAVLCTTLVIAHLSNVFLEKKVGRYLKQKFKA